MRLFIAMAVICSFSFFNVNAQSEEREVSPFSEISLRISGKVYVTQGKKQSVEIVARPSTLEELVTEVSGRELVIRYKTRNLFSGISSQSTLVKRP